MVRILFVVAAVALAYYLCRVMLSSRGATPLKCATCANCRKMFHDGALCAFGNKETFKNIVHVENCRDYQPR